MKYDVLFYGFLGQTLGIAMTLMASIHIRTPFWWLEGGFAVFLVILQVIVLRTKKLKGQTNEKTL